MDYKIIWSIQASKQLERLDRSVAKRIHEKVGQLYQNPERYVEKLIRYPYYRLRVGDYRVKLGQQHSLPVPLPERRRAQQEGSPCRGPSRGSSSYGCAST